MRLYDTLTRSVLPLFASDGKRLRFYACGPTVYGPAHIGNFRTFSLMDVFRRTAEVAGLNPFYVRNITDVDDKTIKGAAKDAVPLSEFTDKWTKKFHEDCARLNLISPDVEPRATTHIFEQVAIVEKLLAGGYAYVGGDGSVYYKVSAFKDYGKLSHFHPEELVTQDVNSAGKANAADEYDREQVADFALWKAVKDEDGDVHWAGPKNPATGEPIEGRPGWHLECSAMSAKYLGASFDLHAGGEDLCFPHHENEIAQSEAANGAEFARHWMHCVHLLAEGKKMSKSLGNFYTLADLLAKGYDARAVKYLLVSVHYRQQLNFTLDNVKGAESAMKRLDKAVNAMCAKAGVSRAEFDSAAFSRARAEAVAETAFAPALDALFDDLNTAAALGCMWEALKADAKVDANPRTELAALKTILFALGIQPIPATVENAAGSDIPDEIKALGEARWNAKQAKDWAKADALRKELTAKGWTILDRKDGWDLKKA
ncbi:MAG TPA: cysteine--tRNA ligase [Opitutales bacterium]|nr:cysteine--tRNA ligase [Opitutales bacterium]